MREGEKEREREREREHFLGIREREKHYKSSVHRVITNIHQEISTT